MNPINSQTESKQKNANHITMTRTDPKTLVCKATPGPWEITAGVTHGEGRLIIESYPFGAIAATSRRGAPTTQSRLAPDSPYYRNELEVIEANARLISAAPQLLEVAQKLLLWMEDRMSTGDFNQNDMDLYACLRQTIQYAGGIQKELQ